MHDVLVRPVFTEKSMKEVAKDRFTFIVDMNSTKDDIKKVVEEMYKVHVLDIAVVIVKGKTKRVGKKRTEKKIGAYKKAVVTLEKGQKIDLFELGDKK